MTAPWKPDIVEESCRRSLVKTFSYRVLGFITTTLVVWACTGRLDLASGIGVIDTVSKLGLFYFHERMWNRISLGRTCPDDYQI